jgi:hypothetical protein
MHRSVHFLGLVCAISGVFSPIACGSEDSGGQTGASSGIDGGNLGEGLSPQCVQCMRDKCRAAHDSCAAEAACREVMACTVPCRNETTCISKCLANHDAGTQKWGALEWCVQGSCNVCLTN